MHAINKMRLLTWLAALACILVLCWAAFQYGTLHAIRDSYIYTENGYYVIHLDGEEWLHFEQK